MDASQIEREEVTALSCDGNSRLRAMVWKPCGTCCGVVQLVHGMAEHIERYDAFARFLAARGYLVFGHDHIGHGKSVGSADELGCLPLYGGKGIMVGDILQVRNAVLQQEEVDSSLPLFIFGHSMGSFITRAFIARHGEGLSGAVICGTGNNPRAVSVMGRSLSRLIGKVKGVTYRSKFVDSLCVGSFSSAIKDARTDCDWLSTDPDVVDDYIADPLSGYTFSVGGYATLTDLTAEVVTKAHAQAVPKELPLFFIAGEQDPVGECGKAVHAAAKLYEDAGVRDVKAIIYPGLRHEILNEPMREVVYADVAKWFAAHGTAASNNN